METGMFSSGRSQAGIKWEKFHLGHGHSWEQGAACACACSFSCCCSSCFLFERWVLGEKTGSGA